MERNLDTILRRVHGGVESMGCPIEYRKFIDIALPGWVSYSKKTFVVVTPLPGYGAEKLYGVMNWDLAWKSRQIKNALCSFSKDTPEYQYRMAEKAFFGLPGEGDYFTLEDIQERAVMVYERVLSARSLGIPLKTHQWFENVIHNIEQARTDGKLDPREYAEDEAVARFPDTDEDEDDEQPSAGTKRAREK